MPDRWKLVSAAVVVLAALALPGLASAGTPDLTQSFYVPQAGDPDPTGLAAGMARPFQTAALTEGTLAVRLFRTCPNNEGGSSLANNARIKVVVRDANGNGIPNVPAADICVLLNGGTPAQGFNGIGADSVIANAQFNPSHQNPDLSPGPACPDVRCLTADGPTNAAGVTFITFTGSSPSSRGVGIPDPNRNWGHYDTELPVYVMGFKISGRITTGSANGTYVLRIKNYDWTAGLGTLSNQGEWVTVTDLNGIVQGIGVNNTISYWKDFDSFQGVIINDLNLLINHLNHNCNTPFSPGP